MTLTRTINLILLTLYLTEWQKNTPFAEKCQETVLEWLLLSAVKTFTDNFDNCSLGRYEIISWNVAFLSTDTEHRGQNLGGKCSFLISTLIYCLCIEKLGKYIMILFWTQSLLMSLIANLEKCKIVNCKP